MFKGVRKKIRDSLKNVNLLNNTGKRSAPRANIKIFYFFSSLFQYETHALVLSYG